MNKTTTTRKPHYMDGWREFQPGTIVIKDSCEMEFIGSHASTDRYRPQHDIFVFRVLCPYDGDKDYNGENEHWHGENRNHHVRQFKNKEDKNMPPLIVDGNLAPRW